MKRGLGVCRSIYVKEQTIIGHDFAYYKSTTLQRRIRRRMILHRLERVEDYVRYLQDHPDEIVRDMCVFAEQNAAKDPPFSRLDLISCRNLLIYMGPVLQRGVMHTFHYALKPDGFLLLGTAFELTQANNDLINLIASVEIPVVIVGQDLRIRRYTPEAEKLLNLISTEVGRPISDINPNIEVPGFRNMLTAAVDDIRTSE